MIKIVQINQMHSILNDHLHCIVICNNLVCMPHASSHQLVCRATQYKAASGVVPVVCNMQAEDGKHREWMKRTNHPILQYPSCHTKPCSLLSSLIL